MGGEFMISPIHYIYIIYYWICQFLGLCVRINDSGLFAWISLTALSRTYFIIIHIGLIIFIPLTNRVSPILRFQAGSAITMECICVHKYIYSEYILHFTGAYYINIFK